MDSILIGSNLWIITAIVGLVALGIMYIAYISWKNKAPEFDYDAAIEKAKSSKIETAESKDTELKFRAEKLESEVARLNEQNQFQFKELEDIKLSLIKKEREFAERETKLIRQLLTLQSKIPNIDTNTIGTSLTSTDIQENADVIYGYSPGRYQHEASLFKGRKNFSRKHDQGDYSWLQAYLSQKYGHGVPLVQDVMNLFVYGDISEFTKGKEEE